MRAELAAAGSRRARWAFAAGCLRAAVWPDQLGRAGRYAGLVAASVAVAVLSGATGVFRVEVIGLGLLAPPVVWRLGYRDAVVGVVGPGRDRHIRQLVFTWAVAELEKTKIAFVFWRAISW